MDEMEIKYRELLKSLEKKVQEGSVVSDNLLELGHLYIYFDREHDAIKIFEKATELYPTEIITKLWLANTLLNLPEGPLHAERVMKLASEIINVDGEMAAAGYILKDAAIKRRHKYGEKRDDAGSINLLKKAANIAPSWPCPHEGLLAMYWRIGKYEEALYEAKLVIDSFTDPVPNSSLSQIRFETMITGRWGKHRMISFNKYISELQELIEKKRRRQKWFFWRKKE
jgi:tetratricopeptide (TPR) repeat protein